ISSAIAVSAILIGSVAISSFLIAPLQAQIPQQEKDECLNNLNCGARKIQTTETYYGIQATLTLPQQVQVPNNNNGSYMAFYLGFGDECEGGISYGSKSGEKLGWRKFLNCGSNSNVSQRLSNQDYREINLKLVKNKDGFPSLYINGVLAYTAKRRLGNTTVKAVHSTYNPAGAPSRELNSYAKASFTNIQIKISPDESGSYKLLPRKGVNKNPWPNFSRYTESTTNGLETSLQR
ncbi:MAG: hypothetical protein ACKPGN_20450, partial [Dolichospermum sp.]